MTQSKKYYLIFLPIMAIELLLALSLSLPIEIIIPFLTTALFAMFLEHPEISTYKDNPRTRLSFVSVVFSVWNILNEKIKEGPLKKYVLRHGPGIIFGSVIIALAGGLWMALSLCLGIINFELIRLAYMKSL